MIAKFSAWPRGVAACALMAGACTLAGTAHAGARQTMMEASGAFAETALVTHWSLPAKAEPVGALPEPAFVRPLTGPQAPAPIKEVETAPNPAATAKRQDAKPVVARLGPALVIEDLSATHYSPYDAERRYRTPPDIKRLEMAFQVFNAADAISTVACLRRADCHEQNPIYGKHPKTAMVIGAKAIAGGVHYWVMRSLLPDHPGVARAFGWFTATVQGGVVGLNMSQLF